jgi:hypothetical protein
MNWREATDEARRQRVGYKKLTTSGLLEPVRDELEAQNKNHELRPIAGDSFGRVHFLRLEDVD